MPTEHFIRWEVDRMSELTVGGAARESPINVLEGLSWNIRVLAESSARTGNVPYFGVWLVCTCPDSKRFWKCENQFTIVLRNRSEESKTKRSSLITKPFYHDSGSLGMGYLFGEIAHLLDSEEGFLLDDKLIVEVSITISRTVGVGRAFSIILSVTIVKDFSEPDESCDVCLIVENKRIHVAKANLALISPTLKTMVYGKFEENGKREIELKDIKHKDFVDFLNVMYSSLHVMRDDSVEGILAIADQFNAKVVLEAVEAHLLSSYSKLPMANKLLLTDLYKLDNAQAELIYSIKKTDEMRVIETNQWYYNFSDKLKARVCDRTMELLNA